ncbi:ABC transporter substrate-binding protein [Planctomycetaceae bacterium SH139]
MHLSLNRNSATSVNMPASISQIVLRALLFAAACLGLLGGSISWAQITPNYATETEPESEGIELLQTDPYDLVRFKSSAGGGWAKVELLPLPGRQFPARPTGSLAMTVRGLPGKTYEAKWADIESIEFWEERLQREYEKRKQGADFSGAYPFLAILYRDNPGAEAVEEMRREYLLLNAQDDFKGGDLKRTLAMLEELRRISPNYKTETVLAAIGRITDTLMQRMMDADQLEAAQKLLARLEQDYDDSQVSSIRRWNSKFLGMAESKREEALAARDAKRWRDARKLALDSLYLYPRIPGGEALVKEIDRAYPLVNVGVLQAATELDPTRIDNWPARRTGRLMYRSLFEMSDAGPEGGEYDFLFGDFNQTPDRMELQLELHPERLSGPLANVDSFLLGDRLTAMTQRDASSYIPAWAATLNRLSVPGPRNLGVYLRHPHVLPHSLLRVKVDGSWAGLPEGSPTGDYFPAPDNNEEGIRRFLLKDQASDQGMRPREVVEIQQDDASDAVTALLRGELDVLDHLFPADAQRLASRPEIRVGNYPLPTVHMLIPVSEHPYLADRTFRRAIAYGISREEILKTELLGNAEVPGCRVVSGPFPAGTSQDDPLAYAYDERIVPRTYQPRVASLLKTMSVEQLKLKAKKDKEELAELTPIRLGYPKGDLPRIACQAIAQQLNMVEIPVELVELPEGVARPSDDSCDLIYTVVALWEPVTDARRVLGPDGLAGSRDQLVGLGLRRLERAKNWREVRTRLFDLHFIAHNELPVIPLWQLVDSYAFRTELGGMGADVVSLYQNVDRWRLNR